MRGGKRAGAGRKSSYGYTTKAIRVPEFMVDRIEKFITNTLPLPLFESGVSAGQPFPGSEEIESKLDINDYLVPNPGDTFLAKATGESMIGAGINDGDLLVVDRKVKASDGKIIVATIEGGLTVKRLVYHGNQRYLKPENDGYKMIALTENMEMHIWGVVTSIIRKF